jgi:hypothetical protein
MKPIRLILGVAALIAFASCRKKLSISSLSFSVNTSSTSYHLGDTVHFIFSGNPDNISFYSGETGTNYANRNRVTLPGLSQLQFTSYAQYATQQNTLKLLVSNNFNSLYDSADIYKATWKDITSRATLSTGLTGTPSGIVDLSDFAAQNLPVYIAFKYVAVTGSTQPTWTIQSFNLALLQPDITVTPVATIANAGWSKVNVLNAAAIWGITATQLSIAGGNATAAGNEDWAISSLLYLNKVAPDVAVPIKNITQVLNSYNYVFSKPGLYKVVFLAGNATADAQQSSTKEVDLTIQ